MILEKTERTGRLAAPREEVRTALLDAMDRLLVRYGYRKTTVEDIAREAGVSRATTYLYFAGKEEIALAWADRRSREVQAEMQQIAEGAGTPMERLHAVLLARVLIRFDKTQNYTESIDDLLAALRPALLARRDEQHEAEAVIVARVLQEGKDAGVFEESLDPLATARLLLLATNSQLPYSLSVRQLGERSEVEARTRDLIQLLQNGFRRRDNAA